MPTYIALLRSVNVGGNRLLTQAFSALLEGLGLTHVSTYGHTGNAVFQASPEVATNLPARLKNATQNEHGFAPEVVVLDVAELGAAVEKNPFPGATDTPKALHLSFLTREPEHPDLAILEKVKADNEAFVLSGKVFYFYAPSGVGRSKAFAKIEKALSTKTTARNWRTVTTLLEMARSPGGKA